MSESGKPTTSSKAFSRWAGIATKQPTRISRVTVHPDGRIEFFSEAGPVEVEYGWVGSERDRLDGRKKTLSYIKTEATIITLDEHAALQSYGFIFAIDTNLATIRGAESRVACVVQCRLGQDKTKVQVAVLGAFTFPVSVEKPENFGWAIFQQFASPAVGTGTACLIADSDFGGGRHTAYNERTAPIFEGVMLANNLTLVYATGDSGGSLPNKLIRLCDSSCTKIAAKISDGTFADSKSMPVANQPDTVKFWPSDNPILEENGWLKMRPSPLFSPPVAIECKGWRDGA